MKQHEKAKAWRERMDLSIEQLADLSGYSVHAIFKFERGSRNKGRNEEHSDWSWQRYKMACAAVDAQLSGRKFSW